MIRFFSPGLPSRHHYGIELPLETQEACTTRARYKNHLQMMPEYWFGPHSTKANPIVYPPHCCEVVFIHPPNKGQSIKFRHVFSVVWRIEAYSSLPLVPAGGVAAPPRDAAWCPLPEFLGRTSTGRLEAGARTAARSGTVAGRQKHVNASENGGRARSASGKYGTLGMLSIQPFAL